MSFPTPQTQCDSRGTPRSSSTQIRREKPYAFTGLKRGAWDTSRFGACVGEGDYLQQRYRAFYPDPDSRSGKVADAIADVFNFCGFDRLLRWRGG